MDRVPVGMERATGIEPAYQAWEASALPLSYARVSPRGDVRILARFAIQSHVGRR